jgi:hypothetical protein
MKAVIVAGVILALGGLLVAGIVGFFVLDKTTNSNRADIKAATGVALQVLSFNQEVVNALGVPVRMGEVTVQHEEHEMMGPAQVSLSIQVTGAKGSGKASVNLTRAGSKEPWQLTSGNFFPSNGPPIFLRPR